MSFLRSPQRLHQLLWLGIALVLFVLAGVMSHPLQVKNRKFREAIPGRGEQDDPTIRMLTAMPGGLRAPLVNYLWIRANELKDEGRYYDARQMAEWICYLQPRFDGVWSFHAWNMAWNISVATHTEQERWQWVTNGMKLLRDEGIPYNPQSIVLYKELGWLFFSKMGGDTDEMHRYYKLRWAAEMQAVLGAPPAGITADVIEAFRPIAEAPLDRSYHRRDADTIHMTMVRKLQGDQAIRDYLAELEELDIRLYRMGTLEYELDRSLLKAYNRFSEDQGVAVVRFGRSARPTKPSGDAADDPQALKRYELDLKRYELINSEKHRAARDRLIAFLRSQILWNEYRMDPQWMLGLMERFNVPIDWRLVWPHGLYWATYGEHVANDVDMAQIDSLNTGRILLNCLQTLTYRGRLVYIEDPRNPDMPLVSFSSDLRYIEPSHREHMRLIEERLEARRRAYEEDPTKAEPPREFYQNVLGSGHRNYLINAIAMLVAAGRMEEAQERLDWLRTEYRQHGGLWDIQNVYEFVVNFLNREGRPIPRVAISQITIALQAGYANLAAGDAAGFNSRFRYAQRVHREFHKGAAERLIMENFDELARNMLGPMLVEPRQFGYDLSLEQRSRIFNNVPLQLLVPRSLPDTYQPPLYDRIAPALRSECERKGVSFESMFPEPDGLDEYRAQLQQRFPSSR